MAFTFGQSFLQGIQAGQNNRRAEEQLKFQREAQKAANELQMRRLTDEMTRFDRDLNRREDEFGKTYELNKYKTEADVGFTERQVSLGEQAQRLTENQFVTDTINGQDYLARGADLRADQRAREALAIQRAANTDITLTPGLLSGIKTALDTGSYSDIEGMTFNRGLLNLVSPAIAGSFDEVGRLQRGMALRGLRGQEALYDTARQLSQMEPVSPSDIPEKTTFFDRLGALYQDTVGRGGTTARRAQKRKAELDLEKSLPVIDEQIQNLSSFYSELESLPIEVSGPYSQQQAEIAAGLTSDLIRQISDSGLPKKEKEKRLAMLNFLGSRFVNKSGSGSSDEITTRIRDAALEAEDPGDLVNLSKELRERQGN